MKIRTRLGTTIATLLFAAFTSLSGCATTGMQRAEKADTTMKAVEQDINDTIAQINITGASLEDLVRPGQSDVKKAFGKYSDNADKMENMGNRLLKHTEKMSAQGKDYFEEWRKEGNTYKNPEIQALSEQRRSDLSAFFVKIPESSVGVKGALKAYLIDIKEIKTYLSNDLTSKGVESITPTAQKAVTDGNDLKYALSPVMSSIESFRTELIKGGTK